MWTGIDNFVRRFPITTFGVTLGLSGVAIMCRVAAGATDSSTSSFHTLALDTSADVLIAIAALVWTLTSFLYLLKYCRYPQEVHAEFKHAERGHFFFAPHLAIMMLATALRPSVPDMFLRCVFGVCAIFQTYLDLILFHRWIYRSPSRGSLRTASPVMLLAVVGWFFLALLGDRSDVDRKWGIDLPMLFFGVGTLFFALAYTSIFQTYGSLDEPPSAPSLSTSSDDQLENGIELKAGRAQLSSTEGGGSSRRTIMLCGCIPIREHSHSRRGSPALFLLLAPPSVAAGVLANRSDDTFGSVPYAILGAMIFLLLLLLRSGPVLLSREPRVYGEYWAYVFPLSAVASLACRAYAAYHTLTLAGLAVGLCLIAGIVALAVCIRSCMFLRRVLFEEGTYMSEILVP